ncbi:MAG: GNAT family N-acetyltransferase [Ignavibacteriaceae bacterium]|nr:GNAT family N-acetyltransferase [Ignavibacterium sp.]MCC6255778.1 GNAT family N-acetyltransferase [Ignavibacteriaceae bacterium]HMN25160.1 GNAT family protein [Ignavibacteriaceae bacterium]HRP94054.1 GNAT family protein [Ignavibacteriaceae bacterium]HRQ55381.1 GNAT family protein [Ignavibacteriaceae bacterium]
MFIQVGNFQIRDIHLTDVEALVKYANNYKISKFMRDSFPYPYKEENAIGWINYIEKNSFNRLTANVFEGNDASKRALEKAGFILEGSQRKNVFKENKFVDHYIYGLLKEDFKYAR